MIYLYSIIEGLFFTDFFSHSPSKAQNVDVIFAAYDENGKLVSAQKENVTLQQGKNKLDVSGIDFTNSESISVMIWDSMASMRPFADKATINK